MSDFFGYIVLGIVVIFIAVVGGGIGLYGLRGICRFVFGKTFGTIAFVVIIMFFVYGFFSMYLNGSFNG